MTLFKGSELTYFFSAAGDRLDGERRLRLLSFFERECDRER